MTIAENTDTNAVNNADTLVETLSGSNDVEKLADPDKTTLDTAKMKRELALANAKTALAQSENAELSYNNVVLQLALKYKLANGDIINEDGTIERKS